MKRMTCFLFGKLCLYVNSGKSKLKRKKERRKKKIHKAQTNVMRASNCNLILWQTKTDLSNSGNIRNKEISKTPWLGLIFVLHKCTAGETGICWDWNVPSLKGSFTEKWKLPECRALSPNTVSNFYFAQQCFYIFWQQFRHLFLPIQCSITHHPVCCNFTSTVK